MEQTRTATDEETPIRRTLGAAHVLIVGVGGLGAPAALQLATLGVGTIGLIDGDVVEVSNLHRQLIYRSEDIGRPKATVAAERLAAMHPHTTVLTFQEQLNETNLPTLFPQFDFVIDGTDNIGAKFLINNGAIEHGVPYAHAGVVAFRGQTFTILPQRSACLRCLFPTPPDEEDDLPTCQTAGVLGALAGVFGLIQASEAVKFLLGAGGLLTNRLLTCDAWRQRWRNLALAPNPRCPVCRAAARA